MHFLFPKFLVLFSISISSMQRRDFTSNLKSCLRGGGGSSIFYFVYYCLFYFSFGSMTIKITRSHCWYFRWNKTPQSPITLSFSHYFLTGLCIFLLEQKMAKQNIAGNIWPKENEVSNKYAHFPPIKLKK